MSIQNVTVFASSSDRIAPLYKDAGIATGRALAEAGFTQINGGGRTGLMRCATDGALEGGGKVRAVILREFLDRGFCHPHFEGEDLIVEESMPGRKKGLYELGDAFLTLPGGLGTFEEVLEVLSWRQLGFHDKPLVFLDVDGYYQPMLALIRSSVERGFTAPDFMEAFGIVETPAEAIDFLKSYVPQTFSIDSKV